jgi:hypothetical protein
MNLQQAQKRIRELTAENAAMREEIEKHMRIYREQLYEMVEIKVKLQLIREAVDLEVQPNNKESS